MDSISFGFIHIPFSLLWIIISFSIALLVGLFFQLYTKRNVNDSLWGMLFMAFLAGRVWFVLQYFSYYWPNLWSFLDIRDKGFSVFGLIVGGGGYLLYKFLQDKALRKPLGITLLVGIFVWIISGGSYAILTLKDKREEFYPKVGLHTLTGERVYLEEAFSHGETSRVVINFWATWCPPCRAEMPMFLKAQKELPEVTFLFVNQGESVFDIEAFLTRQSLQELENIWLDRGMTLGEAVGVSSYPSTLIYDKEGRLINWHIGMLSRASLMNLLKIKSIE